MYVCIRVLNAITLDARLSVWNLSGSMLWTARTHKTLQHLIPEGTRHEGEVVARVVAVPDGRHKEGRSCRDTLGHTFVHTTPKPVGRSLVPAWKGREDAGAM